jgi:2-polyprenyl-3-methyl-5-hydroxy-6-metoxy-1,4-benzoquinol methylase
MNAKRQAIYTHGHHESVLRSHRQRTAEDSAGYLLPHLRPGMSVLDVGCGPGTITIDLAARVLPGRVTAVEATAEALNLARAEAQSRNRVNLSFAISDVHALDFPDDTFDVVHAHQVLQHVRRPGASTAGDAEGMCAGRDRSGPRLRLRGVHMVPADSGTGPLARPLPARYARQ